MNANKKILEGVIAKNPISGRIEYSFYSVLYFFLF